MTDTETPKSSSERSSLKEWLQRVALMFGFPLVLLAATEYVLWVFNIEPPKDAATKVTGKKLLEVGLNPRVDDPDGLHETFRKSRKKRLVCFGGSTVAGAPFDGKMNMCTVMAEALGKEYELINLAGSGQDSNDVLAHAKLACTYESTLLFVYSGHNEFLNLRRYAGPTPPDQVIATADYLARFRFYRLLQKLLLPNRPINPLELAEPDISDDKVHGFYEKNMRELISTCKGQHLLMSTVISNPQLGFSEPGMTLRQSFRKRGNARPVPLSEHCRHCFRAGPQINRIIRRVSRETDVALVDTTDILKMGQGFELFWDHCHPKPHIHVEIAKRALEKAKSMNWIESYQQPTHSLSAATLSQQAFQRAIYNIQFDPAWARGQLESMESPPDPVAHALSLGIIGFLTDNPQQAKRWFMKVAEELKMPRRRQGMQDCVDRGRNGQGYPCLYWLSSFLMNEGERQELLKLISETKEPLLEALIAGF